jgi:hypothetical protein
MSEAERIAELIKRQLPDIKAGTLRFWGEWFGRPHDNVHRLIGRNADADLLQMYFDESEVLSVWSPHGLAIGEHMFRIADATRVRWEWFYYGRPQTAANRYFEEFVRIADRIEATTNVDWYEPTLRPEPARAAVEIL